MNYRYVTLQSLKAHTADDTETIDLNGLDPISQIVIQAKGLNGSSVPDGHPAKFMTKIEIVDGSKVLYSGSGIQCQAVDYYHNGRIPHNAINFVSGSYCVGLFQLNFGRNLWDTMYALDPRRFVNPQLKYTVDYTGGGGSATSSVSVEVMAKVFDEKKVSPVGFISQREVKSYTLSASTYEYVELPRDYPYRMLIVQSLKAGKSPSDNYSELRLDEDNDKRVIIDESTEDLIKYLLGDYEPITEGIHAVALTTIQNNYCTPTYNTHITALADTDVTAVPAFTQLDSGQFKLDTAANATFSVVATGYIPHGALLIPCGNLQDPTDWYDVRKVGALRLRILAGSGASGTCQVVVQQAISY